MNAPEPEDLSAQGMDPLEKLLSRTAAALPDDGFSSRVMATLPPPDRRHSRLRWILCVVSGVAGLGFAVARVGSFSAVSDSLNHSYVRLVSDLSTPSDFRSAAYLGLAVIVAGISVCFAVFPDGLRRWRHKLSL